MGKTVALSRSNFRLRLAIPLPIVLFRSPVRRMNARIVRLREANAMRDRFCLATLYGRKRLLGLIKYERAGHSG